VKVVILYKVKLPNLYKIGKCNIGNREKLVLSHSKYSHCIRPCLLEGKSLIENSEVKQTKSRT